MILKTGQPTFSAIANVPIADSPGHNGLPFGGLTEQARAVAQLLGFNVSLGGHYFSEIVPKEVSAVS